jgi:hypothetical protein
MRILALAAMAFALALAPVSGATAAASCLEIADAACDDPDCLCHDGTKDGADGAMQGLCATGACASICAPQGFPCGLLQEPEGLALKSDEPAPSDVVISHPPSRDPPIPR